MKQGLYLYALAPADASCDFGAIGVPEDGAAAEVRAVAYQGVAAIVSSHAVAQRLSPTRARLEAHYRVLREAGKNLTLVPVAFGHIATEQDIVRLLKRNYKGILEELESLDGRVQMCVRVDWDAENLFEYFMGIDPDLAALRDEIFGRATPPSEMLKIELGRMFDRRRNEEREKLGESLLASFEHLDARTELLAPHGERRVAEVALLVRRDQVAALEATVYEVAGRWPNGFAFDFSGPFAPFDFVSLELDLGLKVA